MLKALSKNPQNRYQTADEMRKDIARAMAGRAVLATPVLSPDERQELLRAAPVRIEPVPVQAVRVPQARAAASRAKPAVPALPPGIGTFGVVEPAAVGSVAAGPHTVGVGLRRSAAPPARTSRCWRRC